MVTTLILDAETQLSGIIVSKYAQLECTCCEVEAYIWHMGSQGTLKIQQISAVATETFIDVVVQICISIIHAKLKHFLLISSMISQPYQ